MSFSISLFHCLAFYVSTDGSNTILDAFSRHQMKITDQNLVNSFLLGERIGRRVSLELFANVQEDDTRSFFLTAFITSFIISVLWDDLRLLFQQDNNYIFGGIIEKRDHHQHHQGNQEQSRESCPLLKVIVKEGKSHCWVKLKTSFSSLTHSSPFNSIESSEDKIHILNFDRIELSLSPSLGFFYSQNVTHPYICQ